MQNSFSTGVLSPWSQVRIKREIEEQKSRSHRRLSGGLAVMGTVLIAALIIAPHVPVTMMLAFGGVAAGTKLICASRVCGEYFAQRTLKKTKDDVAGTGFIDKIQGRRRKLGSLSYNSRVVSGGFLFAAAILGIGCAVSPAVPLIGILAGTCAGVGALAESVHQFTAGGARSTAAVSKTTVDAIEEEAIAMPVLPGAPGKFRAEDPAAPGFNNAAAPAVETEQTISVSKPLQLMKRAPSTSFGAA